MATIGFLQPAVPKQTAKEGYGMTDANPVSDKPGPGGGDNKGDNERIPTMQRILDNPFLLLFLGVVMPTVFYLIWGIMEIISIPIAK